MIKRAKFPPNLSSCIIYLTSYLLELKIRLIDKETTLSSCTLILHSLVVVAVALLFSISLGLERVWADYMIKNVVVANIPIGVAFNPSNGYTYVTNVDSNTVYMQYLQVSTQN